MSDSSTSDPFIDPDESAQAHDAVPTESRQIIPARLVYPSRLALLPLPNRPIFPKLVSPLAIEEAALVQLVKEAVDSHGRLVGVVFMRQASESAPGDGTPVRAEPHEYGTIAQVLKVGLGNESGPLTVLLGGLDRFRIRKIIAREPHLVAAVEYFHEPHGPSNDETKAYALAIINSIKELVQQSPLFKEELNILLGQGVPDEPGRLADLSAFLTSASGEELQEVLALTELKPRMERSLALLRKEVDISKLQTKIRQQIEERMNKQQREFFLREQLKSIKQELGLEKDDKEAEIQRFLDRLTTRTASDEVKARIDDEVEKLRLLEPVSPEYNLTRNYLDWLTILPWGVRSKENDDIKAARAILEESHYGLDDVKARILEFVAAGLLKGSLGGSIICLVGPPGVGKTSIGRSVAKAVGREFYRFSLGGMRDEAEIKGHRRTYIGAMPGKFLQALRVCKTDNPVIMLDEVDKIGASFQGDPASALLEALDPEQNRDFLDHYLDVRFDLSNILFLCTANQLDTIPPPLLDRMEIIKLSGYLKEEKIEIARRFILPRELSALKLDTDKLTITDEALDEVVEGYARDAGVRSLEQQLKKLIRKSAVRILEEKPERIVIDKQKVAELLGRRYFSEENLYRDPRPGVVMGLAWTSMGGDTLYVEATALRADHGGFKQTGQLGKVMIESSEIAYTHARSVCADDEAYSRFFDEHMVHLHVPAGATPKDGPSAGITMATALYGLARGIAVQPNLAMTGELNLSGHVMPVGGIKEKIIAAKRANVETVILPKANETDYDLLPDYVKKGIMVHFAERFEQVLATSFAAAQK